MKDLKLFFKNKKGYEVEIVGTAHQFIFLEPLSSVVVRYIIKDGGVEVGAKITNEVKETDVVSVKFIKPKTEFLSRKSDFDDVIERSNRAIALPLEFENGICLYDALFTNLLDERVKVKVSSFDVGDQILENEHSYVDGPDEFIRAVNVSIDATGVEYSLMYRRNGRALQAPGRASYETLAKVVKNVLFARDKHYSKVPKPTHEFVEEEQPESILKALSLAGWNLDSNIIYKVDRGRKIPITDEELGILIKDNISLKDLANLFKPKDYANNGNLLISEGENFLVACDSTCSLPEVVPKIIVDNRG